MTHDELLAKIDNVTYAHDNGHTIDKDRIVKQLNGLRAVVGIAKKFQDAKWVNKDFEEGFHVAINIIIQAIEKELK